MRLLSLFPGSLISAMWCSTLSMCPAPDTEQDSHEFHQLWILHSRTGAPTHGLLLPWSSWAPAPTSAACSSPQWPLTVLLPSNVGTPHISGILFHTSEEKFVLVSFHLIFWSGWTLYYWKNILLPAIFPVLRAEKMMSFTLGMTNMWAGGDFLKGSCSQPTAQEGHEFFTAYSTSCWMQEIWGRIGNVLWVLHICGMVTLESAAHIFVFPIRPTPHPLYP